MGLSINDENYIAYKKVFEIIWKHERSLIDPGLLQIVEDPFELINKWEVESKSRAQKALKAGLIEIISNFKEYPLTLLQAINSDLEENGLPNINSLKVTHQDMLNKIIKRGYIKNMDEYYIINEIMSDQANPLEESQRQRLEQYLYDFEIKK